MSDAASRKAENSARLQAFKRDFDYSYNDLAAEAIHVLMLRGEKDIPTQETARRTISRAINQGVLGPKWAGILGEVFGADPEEAFDLRGLTVMPPPLLIQIPVDQDIVTIIAAQLQAHIEVEHALGPQYARHRVETDLCTVETLAATAPRNLRRALAEAAGTIAEVAGWIAQDLGDYDAAQHHTIKAMTHLRAASPDVRALIYMRLSNIANYTDPAMAVDLAADAAELIAGHSTGRLAASIARQQALAALHSGDDVAFREHARAALDLGEITEIPGDRARYAHSAYVASDVASGFLRLTDWDRARGLLTDHHSQWTSQQHRDRTVADLRLLHAYIGTGEYHLALAMVDAAMAAYSSAPSQRARRALVYARKLVADRRRSHKDPARQNALKELAGRMKTQSQGDPA